MDESAERAESFTAHYAVWVTLSHFLSADLVRELSAALVEKVSGGTLTLDQLCEGSISDSPPELATWVVHFTPGHKGLASYLQDVVRMIVWQSDAIMRLDEQSLDGHEVAEARALDAALELATVDFGTVKNWVERDQMRPASLQALGRAIVGAEAHGDGALNVLDEMLGELDPPLRMIAVKHIGDLCLDADRADAALAYYDRALELAQVSPSQAWTSFFSAAQAMTFQSKAAALWLVEGPAASARTLEAGLANSSMAPLLRLNAGVDTMNAQIKAEDDLLLAGDVRACFLVTPQLQVAPSIESALLNWREEKFTQAHRRFWAALRRRIALGTTTLTHEAMAYYALSMFDELGRTTKSQRAPSRFAMALQLLIASGHIEAVGTEVGQRDLVDAYVNLEMVDLAWEIACRHKGARRERLLTLIPLFKAWLMALAPDNDETAKALLQKIVVLAAEDIEQPMLRGRDLGIAAVKAVKDLAAERPEFIGLCSSMITAALLAQLQSGNIHSARSALESALECTEGLEPRDLKRCIDAAVDILSAADPATSAWHLVRPALSLISCYEARLLWENDPAIASRSAQQILRYGLGSERENQRLIALLADIAPYLDALPNDERIAEAVASIREGTRKQNSSGVTHDISVLLSAPTVVGRAGIEDALVGLCSILATAKNENPSIGAALAYDPLLTLTHYLDDIVDALSLSPADEAQLLAPLINTIADFWTAAADKPLLFAPFAIPYPTSPNPVVVQNWAFATLGFAQRVNALDILLPPLEMAAGNPVLHKAIALGRAARLTANDPAIFDTTAIASEARDPFYSALGERLAALASEHAVKQAAIIATLIHQCLRHGPNGLDSGVFALALRLGELPDAPKLLVKAYSARLRRSRDLRKGLQPLLGTYLKHSGSGIDD